VNVSRFRTPIFPRSNLRIVFAAAGLKRDVNLWRRLRREILDPYRPELHYMRGPQAYATSAKHGR
jgi:hypothetical protein